MLGGIEEEMGEIDVVEVLVVVMVIKVDVVELLIEAGRCNTRRAGV